MKTKQTEPGVTVERLRLAVRKAEHHEKCRFNVCELCGKGRVSHLLVGGQWFCSGRKSDESIFIPGDCSCFITELLSAVDGVTCQIDRLATVLSYFDGWVVDGCGLTGEDLELIMAAKRDRKRLLE